MVPKRDRQPQGDPETVVLLPHGGALVGLYIRGITGTAMLGIREDAEGQPVSCAIGEMWEIETAPKPTQSNPRRHPEQEDGA